MNDYTGDPFPPASNWIQWAPSTASTPNCAMGDDPKGKVHDLADTMPQLGAPALLYCRRCGYTQKLAKKQEDSNG